MSKHWWFSLMVFLALTQGTISCAEEPSSNLSSEKTQKPVLICPLRNIPQPKGIASLDAFKKIAILEEGRIKPLDTYARNLLLRFSGRKSFQHKPAIRWLARLLFAPDTTREDKIFLINNPEIPMALGIAAEEKRRYRFAQLEEAFPKIHELALKAIQIEEKSRAPVEEEIIRVEANLRLYAELSRSMAFTFPHPDFAIEGLQVLRQLGLPERQSSFSFLDIASRADQIRRALEGLESQNPESWTPSQREILALAQHLYQWSASYRDLPLAILPSGDPQDERWVSPWDAARSWFSRPAVYQEIILLRDLRVLYWRGEQLEFDIAARAFSDSVDQRAPPEVRENPKRIPLEIFYNRAELLSYAQGLYGLAFLIFLLSLRMGKTRGTFYRLAFVLLGAGWMSHLAALIMRATILHRPPVTNLYETFIFVGFVGGVLGMIVEWIHKEGLGIVVAGISGFLFLAIAQKFGSEGDTMRMLVAVLNSNFWLGTHVLSITTGYAGVCVAGILGHVYILQGLRRNGVTPHFDQQAGSKMGCDPIMEKIYRTLLGVLGFGFTMTVLGTTLGGIWADQSWGRFWGWDPKENGALLIILWCAIVFHAKIGGFIGPLGMAAFSALGIIVVMWAWFGVNLLSVGLHSYGFTTGAMVGLVAYVIGQLMFLGVTVPMVRKRNKPIGV